MKTPYGTATYRIRIEQAPTDQPLAVKLHKTSIAYRLYADDQLIAENGAFEAESREAFPSNTPVTAVFTAAKPDFDLILQVENTNYAIGGAWFTIQFGTEKQIRALGKKRESTMRLLRQAFSITRDEAARMKQFHQRGGLMK